MGWFMPSKPSQLELGTLDRDLVIWSAGFFDGEGCVSIGKQKTVRPANERVDHERRYIGYQLVLIIAQSSRSPLDRLRELFGGYLVEYQNYGATYYRLQYHSQEAMKVLKELLPYLLVKRDVAENGIRFQERTNIWHEMYGKKGYPPEVAMERESYYLTGKMLNARNVIDRKNFKYVGPRARKRLQIASETVQ